MKKKGRNRKEKEFMYNEKYSHIPVDYDERLNWMYDLYNITDKKAQDILNKRGGMIGDLYYNEFNIKLFEEPEGAKRPRYRMINRNNIANLAMANPDFIHVYSPNAKDDSVFMNRVMGTDLNVLNSLIHTPCIVEYNVYFKTPNSFNTTDTFLSEIGLIRPIVAPDWDNIGKKYSDMYNKNVWLDDTLVISATVNKYYSILPRVEINLKYLNMVYNKFQYNSVSKKMNTTDIDYYGK